MSQVLIYGSDHLAFRIAEQLCAEGCVVSVIARPGSWLANALATRSKAGPQLAAFSSEQHTEIVLLQTAKVDQAETLFAITDKDDANLGMTLAALELNPRLRVVLRQFNVRLGHLLEQYLSQVDVMSMSALAATTFALAACSPGVRFAQNLGEDTLVLREANAKSVDSADTRVVLAVEAGSAHWLPPSNQEFGPEARLLVACTEQELPTYPELNYSDSATRSRVSWRTNRILIGVVGYLALVVICASIYFNLRLGMSPLDSVYFVITTITSVGFGDFSLRDSDAVSKIVGILLMVSGVGITAVFFALVTNDLVAHQQAFEQGRVRQRISNHTIVCGLGVVGLRVAQSLQQRGERVVCVEKDDNGRFVGEARHLGIPVVIGDALQEQTLRYANIAQARSLVVCSNPDHLNLEIALNARSLHRDLPIVLRMFDPDLARRVAYHFNLGTTFSSAMLAASRFAAPATGSTRLCNLQFQELGLEFHQVNLSAGEAATEVAARHGGRFVAAVDSKGRLQFNPENSDSFAATSIILVR